MNITEPPKKVSSLNFRPLCPSCKSDNGFEAVLDENTVGTNGMYELVLCKNCKCVVGCSLASTMLEQE